MEQKSSIRRALARFRSRLEPPDSGKMVIFDMESVKKSGVRPLGPRL